MAFGIGFGFQNPVAVQDSIVGNFVAEGLGVTPAPVQQTFVPPVMSNVPLDAQLDLSLSARAALPEQQQPQQFKNHGQMMKAAHQAGLKGQDIAAVARGDQLFQPTTVSNEGNAYMQRRGNNGFRR